MVAFINHFFTRRRTEAETEKLRAEAEKIRKQTEAETRKIEAEAEKSRAEAQKIRLEMGEVRYTQLTREVVFDRDGKDFPSKFYLIDDKGLRRLIPNPDNALLFATHKGLIGISHEQLEEIKLGTSLPEISKDSFCRIKHDFFLIIGEKIFYLTSLSHVYKYWDSIDSVREIRPDELRKYQVFR